MSSSARKSKVEKEREKMVQDRLQLLLTRMLKDEDNKYCVDCDAKGPRWSSWNLGLFLCIRCAGIHRNLGVHISKVKSVNLDSWTPQQVASMQLMGNSRARAVYEANLPDGFSRPSYSDQALEQFIRSKYEKKKYIAREYVATPAPELPRGWQELIEAEKQKKDVRKLVLPSHGPSVNSPGQVDVSKAPAAKAQPEPSGSIAVAAPTTPKTRQQQQAEAAAKPAASPAVVASPAAVSSAQQDLLGLSLGDNSSAGTADILSLGNPASKPPSSPAGAPAGGQQATPPSSSNSQSADDFFKSPASSTTGGGSSDKMSKDSIMALFGKQGATTAAAPVAAVPAPATTSSFQPHQQPMFMQTFQNGGTAGASTHQQQLAGLGGSGFGGANPAGVNASQMSFGVNPQLNPFLNANPTNPGGQGGFGAQQQQTQMQGFHNSANQMHNQFGSLNLGNGNLSGSGPPGMLQPNATSSFQTGQTGQTGPNRTSVDQSGLLGMWQ